MPHTGGPPPALALTAIKQSAPVVKGTLHTTWYTAESTGRQSALQPPLAGVGKLVGKVGRGGRGQNKVGRGRGWADPAWGWRISTTVILSLPGPDPTAQVHTNLCHIFC